METMIDLTQDKRVELHPRPEELEQFLTITDPIYQRIKYNKIAKQYAQGDITIREGKLYFTTYVLTVRMNAKGGFYVKQTHKKGFTYDGKKLHIWFGMDLNAIDMHLLITGLNLNWIESNVQGWITKGSLLRILQGKITNPIDLLRYYLKSIHIKASPKLLYDAVRRVENRIDRMKLLQFAPVVKHVDHWIVGSSDATRYPHLQDMAQQARLLQTKIDCQWSTKRLHGVHQEWTKWLMEIEMSYINDEEAKVPDLPPYPEEFRLLRTNKEVFTEGTSMHHCVYTNYWNSIKLGSYVVFHVSFNGEEATLGLHYGNNEFYTNGRWQAKKNNVLSWSQLYTRFNQSPSVKLENFCKQWFNNLGEDTIGNIVPYVKELSEQVSALQEMAY